MRNPHFPATLVTDLSAIRENVQVISDRTKTDVMAVVKANGYGCGLVTAARAALEGGATWLGVAQVSEAIALREAGIRAPVLAWLYSVTQDLAPAILAGIELGVSNLRALDSVAAVTASTGTVPRVQVAVDTGLGRNGVTMRDLPTFIETLQEARTTGRLEVTGAFTHLAHPADPHHPLTAEQQDRFTEAVRMLQAAGFTLRWTHMANTAACLSGVTDDRPWTLVRPGLGVYGYSSIPDLVPAQDYGLRPAVRLVSDIATVKRVPAGTGVSYGHTYRTEQETTLAVVPLGYADGIPRGGSDRLSVQVRGQRRPVVGAICMDQLMLDVGDLPVVDGDEVVLFGDGSRGEPTLEEFAAACAVIPYEVLAGLGSSVTRCPIGEGAH